MSRATFVIAGASPPGASAALALREEGFDGRVVLVGDEPVRRTGALLRARRPADARALADASVPPPPPPAPTAR